MPKANSCTSRLAGFPTVLECVDLGGRRLRLHVVPDLESLLDRGALLRGEVEPPYWAYLWTGARMLARYVGRHVPVAGLRVLEIGCGLGLPGLAAAAAGAHVTFVDTAAPALAFVRASLASNGLVGETRQLDYRTLPADERFDVVLAAEVAYDRPGFEALAECLAKHLTPNGVGVMADGFRTDTRPLYRALVRRPVATAAIDCRPAEEGRSVPVRLVLVRLATDER